MESSKTNNKDNLGVKKTSSGIRKGSSHQIKVDDFLLVSQQLAEPPIYHISKEDFKDFVQKHTRLQSCDHPVSHVYNPQKSQNARLNKMRPLPLAHVRRSPMLETPPLVPNNSNVSLPRCDRFRQESPSLLQQLNRGNMTHSNQVESPMSAYQRYSQNAMTDPDLQGIQFKIKSQFFPLQPQGSCNVHSHHPPSSSLTHNPSEPMLHFATSNNLTMPTNIVAHPPAPYANADTHPNVNSTSNPSLPSHSHVATKSIAINPHVLALSVSSTHSLEPTMNIGAHPHVANPTMPNIPSPQASSPAILPSITSEFLSPSSPTTYMNLISSQSYNPLLSQDMENPSFENFPLSSSSESWINELLLSPGLFQPSPSGLFPTISPRNGD